MRRSITASILVVLALLHVPDGLAMRGMDFLEKFDLSELTYIGMNATSKFCAGATWATVLDPERLPHYVRRGSYMGKNYGVVTRITRRYIQLRELHRDGTGDWVESTVRVPIAPNHGPRARYRYEEDQALESLGQTGASGRQLQRRLLDCRKLFDKDAERLACFDAAVGKLM